MQEQVPYVSPQPYPPYHGQPQGPPRQGTSTTTIVLVVVVVIIVIVGLGVAFAMMMWGSLVSEPWEDTRDVDEDVYIEDGGHYRLVLSESWEEEVEVNLTISLLEGGLFDVYIMTEEQYDNAYGNSSTGAFSTTFSWQNTSSVHDIETINDPGQTHILVIDNVRMAHVPGNAVPEGPIHVDVGVHIVYRYDVDV